MNLLRAIKIRQCFRPEFRNICMEDHLLNWVFDSSLADWED